MFYRALAITAASAMLCFTGCAPKGGHHAARTAVGEKHADQQSNTKASCGVPIPSYGPIPSGGDARSGYVQCVYAKNTNDATNHPTVWQIRKTVFGLWKPKPHEYFPFVTPHPFAVNWDGSRNYWVRFKTIFPTDSDPHMIKVTVKKNSTTILALPPYKPQL